MNQLWRVSGLLPWVQCAASALSVSHQCGVVFFSPDLNVPTGELAADFFSSLLLFCGLPGLLFVRCDLPPLESLFDCIMPFASDHQGHR